MIVKRIAFRAGNGTNYAALLPALIRNNFREQISAADMLAISARPDLARVRMQNHKPVIEIHLGNQVYITAEQLMHCVNLREFSATDRMNRDYLQGIATKQIAVSGSPAYFSHPYCHCPIPGFEYLPMADFPGLATLRSFTSTLDSYANTWSNPEHYATFLQNCKCDALSDDVRSAIWHTLMVNDGINTLKAIHVLNLFNSDTQAPAAQEGVLFSSQRKLPDRISEYRTPQYFSSTPDIEIAEDFYTPGKVMLCIKDKNQHVAIQDLSIWPNEHEFAIQAGETFRIVSPKTPWISEIQTRHPTLALVGLEPVNAPAWLNNRSLPAHLTERPWLVEKLYKLAYLSRQPELAARFRQTAPESLPLDDNALAAYDSAYLRNYMSGQISRPLSRTDFVTEIINAALRSGEIDLAIAAAGSSRLPHFFAEALVTIYLGALKSHPAESPAALRHLDSALSAFRSAPEASDYFLHKLLSRLVKELPEAQWCGPTVRDILRLIGYLTQPSNQLELYIAVTRHAQSAQNPAARESSWAAWHILDRFQSSYDTENAVRKLMTITNTPEDIAEALPHMQALCQHPMAPAQRVAVLSQLIAPCLEAGMQKLADSIIHDCCITLADIQPASAQEIPLYDLIEVLHKHRYLPCQTLGELRQLTRNFPNATHKLTFTDSKVVHFEI